MSATRNGQPSAYAAAIALLPPAKVADLGARITLRAADRALAAEDDKARSFIDRDRAALDRETLGCLREYAELLNALKEVRT